MKKSKLFQICLENLIYCVKLPEKVEIIRKFVWKNGIFLPASTTPRFQTRLTPLSPSVSYNFKIC